jgi:transcriptional regulator with XRE-family HTH domain
MTRREFGRRLRKLRLGSGLSLRTVAGRVGISHVSLYDFEGGARVPSRETVTRVSDVLGSCSILEDWFSVKIAEADGSAEQWRSERERWRLSSMT